MKIVTVQFLSDRGHCSSFRRAQQIGCWKALYENVLPVMQARPVFQQPYKQAQVQRSDEAKKVEQEIVSEVSIFRVATRDLPMLSFSISTTVTD